MRARRPAAAPSNRPLRAFGVPIGAGGSRARPQTCRRGDLERRPSGNSVRTVESPSSVNPARAFRIPAVATGQRVSLLLQLRNFGCLFLILPQMPSALEAP